MADRERTLTYWHGGGRVEGDEILPSNQTGFSRSGDVGVFVTTDRALAETYASSGDWPTAWLYEVDPVGPIEPVPSTIPGAPTISYRCTSARIVRRFTVSNARREQARAHVRRAAALLGDE